VQQWEAETAHTTKDEIWHVAVQAARWGADQELEACCRWLNGGSKIDYDCAALLRAARRPQPPSLKEQAIAVLEDAELDAAHYNILLRALEQLPDPS
jgi:hypothetical protein